MKSSLSNEYAVFWIDNGILFFEYKPSIVIDVAAAEQIVRDRLQFQEEKAYPILCDTRGIKDTDKAARDYLAREGSLLTKAVAFVVNPPISNAITKFYIKTNKPDTPHQMFTDKYSALRFLEKFKN